MKSSEPTVFDAPDVESPFLSFVASEFHKRGTRRRWELSKKVHSHPFVRGMGMRVPDTYHTLDSLDALNDLALPQRFVLKFANGWSARGVMPLEQVGRGRFFDHLALREYSRDDIVREQERVAGSFGGARPQWIVEDFVESTLSVGAIPFDYKFYCFNGNVGMIGQFDRNANPPRIVLFDGTFRPLEHGRDYIRGAKTLQRGIPVVPRHAAEMLWWAQELSRHVDSPFVSVDMYDSPDGPVFGEFTYSPGGTHKRMFVFSRNLIQRFDALFAGEAAPHPLAGFDLAQRKDLDVVPDRVFRVCAGFAYNHGPRGAHRLAAYHQTVAEQSSGEGRGAWLQHVAGTWEAVAALLQRQVEDQYRAAARQLERTRGVK